MPRPVYYRSILEAALRMQDETGFDGEGLLHALFGPLLERCRQQPSIDNLEIVEDLWEQSERSWQPAYNVAQEIAQALRVKYGTEEATRG